MPQAVPNPAFDALAEWWADMGVEADEVLIRAYQKTASPPPAARSQDTPTTASPPRPALKRGPKSVEDWVVDARRSAAACETIEALKTAIEAFEGCPLKQGCENTAVYDGALGAPVMVIGEGPGAEEDRLAKPFVGRAGKLLDKMLAAINLSRAENAFITNVNYWHPPGNRNPEPEELAVCRPFVDRMITLAAPKLIIAAGNVPTKSLLSISTGIMKSRGREYEYAPPGGAPIPFFPIFHPAFLLRRPVEKSRAWRDLLTIEAKLAELS